MLNLAFPETPAGTPYTCANQYGMSGTKLGAHRASDQGIMGLLPTMENAIAA
jgi:hypothetical protein